MLSETLHLCCPRRYIYVVRDVTFMLSETLHLCCPRRYIYVVRDVIFMLSETLHLCCPRRYIYVVRDVTFMLSETLHLCCPRRYTASTNVLSTLGRLDHEDGGNIYQFTRCNIPEHSSFLHFLGFVHGSRNKNTVTVCNNMRLYIFMQYSWLRIFWWDAFPFGCFILYITCIV
jgi:hypothetical protein